jgi:arylsulfatase A-like enzyme
VEWTKEGQSRGGEYHVLSENIPTTAECLAEKQYSTGYFQANPNADRLRGHARGCEDYYYKINVSSTEHMDAVVAWLKARAKEPFYLFVHMIDPHKPHSVSPEMFAEVHGEELERSLDGISGFGKDLLNTHHVLEGASAFQKVHNLRADDQRKFSKSALEHLVKLYDSEIWGVDREFGRLLQTLEDMGVSDRTVVAFTSDHGEAFGEEDQYNHGNFLDDAQTHVPLLIRVPGQRKGERVPWTVRLSDLHPTLLTLADCDVSAPCTGSSLLSRDGRLLVSGDRGVLTTLDRNRSSRDLWDIGFTQGTLRVRLMKAEDRIEAYDLVSRRGGIVRYDQDPTSRDPRLRSGIQQLFGTVEDYTTRFAASEVGPTWGSEWRGKVSEDALKAVGYR